MTTPSQTAYGIGACLNCRHLFLSTPMTRECPLCGFAPKIFHPLEVPPTEEELAAKMDLAELQPPADLGMPPGAEAGEGEAVGEGDYNLPFEEDTACPCCGRAVTVRLDELGVTLLARKREGSPDEALDEAGGELASAESPAAEGGVEGAAAPLLDDGPPGDPAVADNPPPGDDSAPPVTETPPAS